MYSGHLKLLVCPVTRKSLELEALEQKGNEVIRGKLIGREVRTSYSINDGIPDLVYPQSLYSLDKEFNEKYSSNAAHYDEGMDWLFASFFEEEEEVRTKLVSLLELKPSQSVLNLGCGTGSDSAIIKRTLNEKGKLFNLDLTSGLLKVAKHKLGSSSKNQEYIRANGAYLPFGDNTFDSVFHFGGINMFAEKKKSIQEMARVTRPGGHVVFGDESAAPWLRNKAYGKIITNANPLYKQNPPLHLLPENAEKVSLHYLLGNSFYAISFIVGEEPQLNLDLPIPGKRGGTLRSRYEGHQHNPRS